MPTNKNKKNSVDVVEAATKQAEKSAAQRKTSGELEAFEAAMIQAVKANALTLELVEAAIVASGHAVSEDEHNAAKPVDKAQAALAELAKFGVNVASLTAKTESASLLAVDVKGLAAALDKYGKHVFAYDADNGTSLCTYSIAQQLLATGKASLPATLDFVRKFKPEYASSGHYNTCKRLLKEHYKLNVSQASFSISAK